jgi:hypothetical protein
VKIKLWDFRETYISLDILDVNDRRRANKIVIYVGGNLSADASSVSMIKCSCILQNLYMTGLKDKHGRIIMSLVRFSLRELATFFGFSMPL